MARRNAGRLALSLILCAGCASLGTLLGYLPADSAGPVRLDRPVDLLPPDGLRVTSTEDRSISMGWNPVLVGEVAGYAVLRANDPGGPFELVGRTGSRFGTVFEDTGETEQRLGDGKTYHYRIHPLDAEGRISRSHAYISATTDPPPGVPDGLRAYSNLPRRVVLAWDPNDGRSVTGYTILRSPTAAGPWEHVGHTDGRLNTVYEDPVPGDLRVMYYRLVAVNRFGGESEPTQHVRAVTKAEPLPPIGLSVTGRRLGAIDLEWRTNVERDLTAYVVLRSVEREDRWSEEREMATVPSEMTTWSDPEVGCAQRVRYRLRALDVDGLESGPSLPLEAVGEDLGLEIRPGGEGGSVLHWDHQRVQDWPYARISRPRWVVPDRLLGTVSSQGSFGVSHLGPGSHRLSVTLTHRDPSAPRSPGDAPDSPTCTVEFELP